MSERDLSTILSEIEERSPPTIQPRLGPIAPRPCDSSFETEVVFHEMFDFRKVEAELREGLLAIFEGTPVSSEDIYAAYTRPTEHPYAEREVLLRPLMQTLLGDNNPAKVVKMRLAEAVDKLHKDVLNEQDAWGKKRSMPSRVTRKVTPGLIDVLFEKVNLTIGTALREEFGKLVDLSQKIELPYDPTAVFNISKPAPYLLPTAHASRSVFIEGVREAGSVGEDDLRAIDRLAMCYVDFVTYKNLRPRKDKDPILEGEAFFSTFIAKADAYERKVFSRIPARQTVGMVLKWLETHANAGSLVENVRYYVTEGNTNGREEPEFPVRIVEASVDGRKLRLQIYSQTDLDGKEDEPRIIEECLDLCQNRTYLRQTQESVPKNRTDYSEIVDVVAYASQVKLPSIFDVIKEKDPLTYKTLEDIVTLSQTKVKFKHVPEFDVGRVFTDFGFLYELMKRGGREAYDVFKAGLPEEWKDAEWRTILKQDRRSESDGQVYFASVKFGSSSESPLGNIKHIVLKEFSSREALVNAQAGALYAALSSPELRLRPESQRVIKLGQDWYVSLMEFYGPYTLEDLSTRMEQLHGGESEILAWYETQSLDVVARLVGRAPKNHGVVQPAPSREDLRKPFSVKVASCLNSIGVSLSEEFYARLYELQQRQDGDKRFLSVDAADRNLSQPLVTTQACTPFDFHVRERSLERIFIGALGPYIPAHVEAVQARFEQFAAQVEKYASEQGRKVLAMKFPYLHRLFVGNMGRAMLSKLERLVPISSSQVEDVDTLAAQVPEMEKKDVVSLGNAYVRQMCPSTAPLERKADPESILFSRFRNSVNRDLVPLLRGAGSFENVKRFSNTARWLQEYARSLRSVASTDEELKKVDVWASSIDSIVSAFDRIYAS